MEEERMGTGNKGEYVQWSVEGGEGRGTERETMEGRDGREQRERRRGMKVKIRNKSKMDDDDNESKMKK